MPLVLRTSQAHLDLVEIAFRIANENPTAADRWLDIIDGKCRMLSQMPELGRRRSEFDPNLRSLPVGNYVIFYRPIQDGIQVIRVLHGARDMSAHL
ncbi:MAG: type II toxin-antitoxin system RelE/ParE family toxin [Limisphaerales bacterium]